MKGVLGRSSALLLPLLLAGCSLFTPLAETPALPPVTTTQPATNTDAQGATLQVVPVKDYTVTRFNTGDAPVDHLTLTFKGDPLKMNAPTCVLNSAWEVACTFADLPAHWTVAVAARGLAVVTAKVTRGDVMSTLSASP